GVGASVRRSIRRPEPRNYDPFLILDELPIDKCDGFPDHPHRRFKTVRYMLGGQFQKEDFAGHKVTIGPDDLQWMTAGRGIVHSTILVKSKNRARKLQLWINLAKEHMMRKPQYQVLFDGQLPRAISQDVSSSKSPLECLTESSLKFTPAYQQCSSTSNPLYLKR
ncbi:RmlC-like cupin domain-containing protein, partial [Linnemannia elongata]